MANTTVNMVGTEWSNFSAEMMFVEFLVTDIEAVEGAEIELQLSGKTFWTGKITAISYGSEVRVSAVRNEGQHSLDLER